VCKEGAEVYCEIVFPETEAMMGLEDSHEERKQRGRDRSDIMWHVLFRNRHLSMHII